MAFASAAQTTGEVIKPELQSGHFWVQSSHTFAHSLDAVLFLSADSLVIACYQPERHVVCRKRCVS